MAPSPRPGTLEWLADQRSEEAVLLTPDGGLTRAEWEAQADALAERLAAQVGVGPGDLLSASGRIGPEWFVACWAAAKLGAGLAGLPDGPGVGLPGAAHLTADRIRQSAKATDRATLAASRRLSGSATLPDSVTFSRSGRPVRRSFTPESVGTIGATLADLVARMQAVPGTTLVLAGPVADALLTFLANVVLVGGGRVVTAPEPAAALALAAEHDAGTAALTSADLATLAGLPEAERERLDLTAIHSLVTGGAPFDAAARAVADDLFGAEAVIDAYATADTGVIAVRGPGEEHHALLDGVELRTTAGGLLEVRSPLAAAPGWIATGDRGVVLGDAVALG